MEGKCVEIFVGQTHSKFNGLIFERYFLHTNKHKWINGVCASLSVTFNNLLPFHHIIIVDEIYYDGLHDGFLSMMDTKWGRDWIGIGIGSEYSGAGFTCPKYFCSLVILFLKLIYVMMSTFLFAFMSFKKFFQC